MNMNGQLISSSMELLEFLFAAFIVATLPPEETSKEEEEATAEEIVAPAIPVQQIEESSHYQEPQDTDHVSHIIDDSPHAKTAGMWIKEAFIF